jgi:hypothetical protein
MISYEVVIPSLDSGLRSGLKLSLMSSQVSVFTRFLKNSIGSLFCKAFTFLDNIANSGILTVIGSLVSMLLKSMIFLKTIDNSCDVSDLSFEVSSYE